MEDKPKQAISISWPAVPEKPNASDLVVAMGRLTMAWSSSEFYFGLILARLMGQADLSTPDKVLKAINGKAVISVDMTAVYALYFAVESSRGRRKLVLDLAKARVGEGRLTQVSFEKIKALADEHGAIGTSRNVYAHTAIGQADDGSYVFLNEKLMISRTDGSRKQRSPRVRAGNNKVHVKMIDALTDRLATWIEKASDCLNQIATSDVPLPPVQEGSAR